MSTGEWLPPVATVIGGLVLARVLSPRDLIKHLQGLYDEAMHRIQGLEAREYIRDDYILTLRQHITDEKPPPPPPWPEALTRGAIHD